MTIVAAWMRAETGVGPAMASGSQTWSGNCADLPHAPTNRSRQIRVRYGVYGAGFWAAAGKTVAKSSEPKRAKTPKIPRMNPKSPIRLTMNAFLPASAANFLW